MKAWPYIHKRAGRESKLYVAYGLENFVQNMVWSHGRIGEMCLEIIHLMKQGGVVDLGKIGQKQLAELQMNASAWLYPCDPIQATETGCITAIENMAAGNPCFISDADCLPSEFGEVSVVTPLPFNAEWYAEIVLNTLDNKIAKDKLSRLGRDFAEKRDWKVIAPTWIDLIKEQNA